MKKILLTKPHHVRRLLSNIINEVHNNEIEVNKANCIGQLCNIMLRAMEKSDIEQRIEEMENYISKFENKINVM